jgi:hypothetical protein
MSHFAAAVSAATTRPKLDLRVTIPNKQALLKSATPLPLALDTALEALISENLSTSMFGDTFGSPRSPVPQSSPLVGLFDAASASFFPQALQVGSPLPIPVSARSVAVPTQCYDEQTRRQQNVAASDATSYKVVEETVSWRTEVLELEAKEFANYIASHKLTSAELKELKQERRRHQNRKYAKDARLRRKQFERDLEHEICELDTLAKLHRMISSDIAKYASMRKQYLEAGGDLESLSDQNAEWVPANLR